jgi:hypothetical protein
LRIPNELPFQQSHHPACDDHSAEKQREAICTIAHHLARSVTLRDSENNRGTGREDQRGGEVCEIDIHDFFPIAMW